MPVEKMLLKLARQLDSMDEASLMALWSKYANLTSRFEPTRRWEEACLVLSLIQAKHFKNQLFNYRWQKERKPPESGAEAADAPQAMPGFGPFDITREAPAETGRCKVLSFRSQDRES